ncbi:MULTISPECIES: ribbon-helix-helix domain-containing protein [Aerosakkonema]|uniref:ribbon-helix-helix domain-containing protein n=1 Tax=Aerosakkonema TaxID=1246629 RepID=UPI0035B86304
MDIKLSSRHEKFIQEQIQNGRYPSADEMIALALELLKESIYLEDSGNRQRYEKWLAETRQKVAVGIAQLEQGEKLDGEEVFIKLFSKLEQFKVGDG